MSFFEALIAEAGKRREAATEYQKYLQYYEECFKTAKRLLVEGRSSRTVMTAENLEALKHEWLSWLSPRLLAVLRDHETKHTPAWELFPFYLDHMHDPARIHTNVVILPEIEDEQDEDSRAAIAAVTPCPCDDRQPNSEFGSRRMAPVSGCYNHAAEEHLLGWLEQLAVDLGYDKGDYEEDEHGDHLVDISKYFFPSYRTVIGSPSNPTKRVRRILRD